MEQEEIQQDNRQEQFSRNLLENLYATYPWILFVSIIAFVGGGFMMLAGLTICVMFFRYFFIGLIYVIFSALLIFVNYYLYSYSASIKKFVFSRNVGDLENAMHMQKYYWRIQGIMIITMFLMIVLFYIVIVSSGMLHRNMLDWHLGTKV